MYFIIRYNWSNDDSKLTNKCSVGYFRSLRDAKKFVIFHLPYNLTCNTVAIVKSEEGYKEYGFPIEVFEWSETYQVYIPVVPRDARRSLTLSY